MDLDSLPIWVNGGIVIGCIVLIAKGASWVVESAMFTLPDRIDSLRLSNRSSGVESVLRRRITILPARVNVSGSPVSSVVNVPVRPCPSSITISHSTPTGGMLSPFRHEKLHTTWNAQGKGFAAKEKLEIVNRIHDIHYEGWQAGEVIVNSN